MTDWLKVYAPATIANIGPGFDVLACALKEPAGDYVWARKRERPGVEILQILGDFGQLSYDVNKNTAGYAAQETMARYPGAAGVELKILKNELVPLGSGLGTSASSAAAAAYATALLYDARLNGDPSLERTVKKELVPICARAERIGITTSVPGVQVAQAEHSDNVAAALLGGFVLSNKRYAMELGTIPALQFTVFNPYKQLNRETNTYEPYAIRTAHARAALPYMVRLADAVTTLGHLGQLVYAIQTQNMHLFGAAIHDALVEPARAKKLMPWYQDVRRTALESGALGCALAGSGPSFFIVTPTMSPVLNGALIKTVNDALLAAGLEARVYTTPVDTAGARKV
ncbi:homoserine kinase [Candidatus Woesearchaeota archaeon]|nr:homoserine kinase [Candidatus Woesearchaeota archaeon]